jgi:hypothetical protein
MSRIGQGTFAGDLPVIKDLAMLSGFQLNPNDVNCIGAVGPASADCPGVNTCCQVKSPVVRTHVPNEGVGVLIFPAHDSAEAGKLTVGTLLPEGAQLLDSFWKFLCYWQHLMRWRRDRFWKECHSHSAWLFANMEQLVMNDAKC